MLDVYVKKRTPAKKKEVWRKIDPANVVPYLAIPYHVAVASKGNEKHHTEQTKKAQLKSTPVHCRDEYNGMLVGSANAWNMEGATESKKNLSKKPDDDPAFK